MDEGKAQSSLRQNISDLSANPSKPSALWHPKAKVSGTGRGKNARNSSDHKNRGNESTSGSA